MTFKPFLLSLTVAAALTVAAPANAADYVQASGALSFASQYQGEVFTGQFPGFRTTLSFDPSVPKAAKLDVLIPLAGASTQNSERDSTLRSSDFFSVGKFAQARYTANGFRSLGGNKYAADGTLTLRGVSQEVTLEVTLNQIKRYPLPPFRRTAGFSATSPARHAASRWCRGRRCPA